MLRRAMSHNPNRYMIVGLIVFGVSAVFATYLNMEGVKCLTSLSSLNESPNSAESEKVSEACFVITNSYVYSVFGVVAGSMLLAYWAYKRKRLEGKAWESL